MAKKFKSEESVFEIIIHEEITKLIDKRDSIKVSWGDIDKAMSILAFCSEKVRELRIARDKWINRAKDAEEKLKEVKNGKNQV